MDKSKWIQPGGRAVFDQFGWNALPESNPPESDGGITELITIGLALVCLVCLVCLVMGGYLPIIFDLIGG